LEYDERELVESLPEIKQIMAEHPSDFFQILKNICLKSGLKVVYTPCLSGASINGSTRWIGDSPLIQLSARYKQNDIFWFTFFHEIAHILLHGKKYIALERVEYKEFDKAKEDEADAFAVKWTFSEEEEAELMKKPVITEEDVEFYAKKFNTHPACIIGRLHHKELIHYSVGRRFLEKIDLSEVN
jgi:Zn-dependent peptidase ImmA (M78 family)